MADCLNRHTETAAIVTGPEAHDDPSKRWIGIAAGLFYTLSQLFYLWGRATFSL